MARLQILELPEGASDERAPFVLVVDEHEPRRYMMGLDQTEQPINEFDGIAEKTGARCVLVFAETIEIPANDTSGYLRDAVEAEVEAERDELHAELGLAPGQLHSAALSAIRGKSANIHELIGRAEQAEAELDVRKRVEKEQRAALLDALGMDPTRDWDDIRNAAAGLRKQRDAQAAELEQLRAGEEPGWRPDVVPTPGQWIARWNQVTPERRLSMAAQTVEGMTRGNDCLMLNHAAELAELRAEVARLRAGPVDA